MSSNGWVGFDLDGCLAHYGGWKPLVSNNQARRQGLIGAPIPPMVVHVQTLLARGIECRIFTARVSDGDPETVAAIEAWCLEHIGQKLPVTNVKDQQMRCLVDDRAVAVEKNTGRILGGELP